MFAAILKSVAVRFTQAHRYQRLFEMNDHELATRGLCRDGLVRSYISGLGLN